MIRDLLIILLFFILRLPLQMLIDDLIVSEVLYRIIADSVIIVLLLLLLRGRGHLTQTILGWRTPKFRDLIIGMLIACILLALSLSISFILNARISSSLNMDAPLYLIYILLFIASITEELFYRGFFLLRLLEVRISPLYAIAISAIMFGLSHVYLGVGSILFSTVAGILLGFAMLTYHSLPMSIIAHFSYNAFYYTLHTLYNI